MPLLCTKCQKTTEDVRYEGPVLIASGVAAVDDTGKIVGLGPVRALETIKAGDELKSLSSMTFSCPSCKAKGGIDLFEVVRACYLTGNRAVSEARTPIGSIWVAEGLEPLAREIFTEENSNWEQLY